MSSSTFGEWLSTCTDTSYIAVTWYTHLLLCVSSSRFLHEVQEYSEQNKMNIVNLGTIFGPHLLRPNVSHAINLSPSLAPPPRDSCPIISPLPLRRRTHMCWWSATMHPPTLLQICWLNWRTSFRWHSMKNLQTDWVLWYLPEKNHHGLMPQNLSKYFSNDRSILLNQRAYRSDRDKTPPLQNTNKRENVSISWPRIGITTVCEWSNGTWYGDMVGLCEY